MNTKIFTKRVIVPLLLIGLALLLTYLAISKNGPNQSPGIEDSLVGLWYFTDDSQSLTLELSDSESGIVGSYCYFYGTYIDCPLKDGILDSGVANVVVESVDPNNGALLEVTSSRGLNQKGVFKASVSQQEGGTLLWQLEEIVKASEDPRFRVAESLVLEKVVDRNGVSNGTFSETLSLIVDSLESGNIIEPNEAAGIYDFPLVEGSVGRALPHYKDGKLTTAEFVIFSKDKLLVQVVHYHQKGLVVLLSQLRVYSQKSMPSTRRPVDSVHVAEYIFEGERLVTWMVDDLRQEFDIEKAKKLYEELRVFIDYFKIEIELK